MASTEYPHNKKQAAAQVAKLKAAAAKKKAKLKTRDLLHRKGDTIKIVAKPAKKKVGPNIVKPMVAKKKPKKSY
jgi:hypothetical protein